MTAHETRVRDALAAYAAGDFGPVEELFAADAQWLGVEGVGGETPIWRDLREVPAETIERDDDVIVGFAPGFYKVFTFRGDRVVRLQDCVDRDDALRRRHR